MAPPGSPLVRVGFSPLPHVIGCGLAEVQAPHGHLGDLATGQTDPAQAAAFKHFLSAPVPVPGRGSSGATRSRWTYLTGRKGLLLRSGCDCSMVTWRLGDSICGDRNRRGRAGRGAVQRPRTTGSHLDPKHFDQEVVDLLRTSGRADVSRFRGHADVRGDLEVVLLLAHEGLVGAGEQEALVRVHVEGGRRPGGARRVWWLGSLFPRRQRGGSLRLHSQRRQAAAEHGAPPLRFVPVPGQVPVGPRARALGLRPRRRLLPPRPSPLPRLCGAGAEGRGRSEASGAPPPPSRPPARRKRPRTGSPGGETGGRGRGQTWEQARRCAGGAVGV